MIPLLLLLAGCGLDVVGTWQIDRMSVAGSAIDDAGFLDIRNNGDVSSGLLHAAFFRYWWDAEGDTWTPDPTPLVGTASFDVFAFQDEPGAAELRLDFPVSAQLVERAVFLPEAPRGGAWELSDPDWTHGALVLELVR